MKMDRDFQVELDIILHSSEKAILWDIEIVSTSRGACRSVKSLKKNRV